MSVVARWQLPPVHVDVVLEYLGLGDLVLPLAVPSFGHTTEQFADIGRRELGNMVANGAVVDDEVHPALAEALRLLAHPHLWVDSVWFPQVGEDHCWRTVAVRTEGDRVVLGVQPPAEDPRFGGMLTVEVHQNVPLPQVLLGTLPPAPPGTRGAPKVPASSFRVGQEEAEPGSVLQTATRARGSSGDREHELYQAIGRAPHVRVGQIAANSRDPHGRTRRSPILRWFDNVEPDGRYLDHDERGVAGERIHMLTPADARLIGAQVDALLAQVR
ncbi:ESX secretion-associated protein EspG [Saccharopolyspora rosea]|uniref:ESX secretion-associated protein EspG n=1 Tax=Saccharopolyspora rosea TaxID=524884 RepID=A0ABW3FP59_9PSEU|nr:ESX secretion-associated protein EspG [Saccharopolyspora rosea]